MAAPSKLRLVLLDDNQCKANETNKRKTYIRTCTSEVGDDAPIVSVTIGNLYFKPVC